MGDEEPVLLDELKGEEIDFKKVLAFQLNDIRKYANLSMLVQYVNSINALEALSAKYVSENSKYADEYKKTIAGAEKKFAQGLLKSPDFRHSYDKTAYEDEARKEFADTKFWALMVLLGEKGLLPRDVLK